MTEEEKYACHDMKALIVVQEVAQILCEHEVPIEVFDKVMGPLMEWKKSRESE